jgi:hypothetical protein
MGDVVLEGKRIYRVGFWYDLEASPAFELGNGREGVGEFREMVKVPKPMGEVPPGKCSSLPINETDEKVHALVSRFYLIPREVFDVVADVTTARPMDPGLAVVMARDTKRVSRSLLKRLQGA